MLNSNVGFEWTIGDHFYGERAGEKHLIGEQADGIAERVLGIQDRLAQLREGPRRGRVFQEILLVALTGLIVTSGFFLNQFWRVHEATKGIQQTMIVEMDAWQRNDKEAFDALFDPEANRRWLSGMEWGWQSLRYQGWIDMDITAQHVEMRDGFALVRTKVAHAAPDTPSVVYSRYRFYRQVDGAWLRTTPTGQFWGEEESYLSDVLHLSYHEADAQVMEVAAPEIEAAYVAFYQLTGTQLPTNNGPLRIDAVLHSMGGWSATTGTLRVPSYLIEALAPDLSDQEAFTQSVVSRLVIWRLYNIQPQSENYASQQIWRSIFTGLHTWLVHEMTGSVPLDYRHADATFRQGLIDGKVISLAQLDRGRRSAMTQNDWLWQTGAGRSLIAYAMNSYGRETLPAFISNIPSATSWSDFITTTYGITQEEFEAGWNHYVKSDAKGNK